MPIFYSLPDANCLCLFPVPGGPAYFEWMKWAQLHPETRNKSKNLNECHYFQKFYFDMTKKKNRKQKVSTNLSCAELRFFLRNIIVLYLP